MTRKDYWKKYNTFCSDWLRLKLITKIGLHTNIITTHHHPPPHTTQTHRQQYLSCYLPDFDQTWNVGAWKHLQQISTITMTFVQARFVLGTFVHIRNISAVNVSIYTNFKGRFLEHGDICPYQQNLGCHWSDFDQTLKVVFLGQSLIDANFQGDISPYQQYLSFSCPDFDKASKLTFLDHL